MLAERPVAALEGLLNHHISESTAARDQLFALAGRSLAVHVVGYGTHPAPRRDRTAAADRRDG